MRHKQQHQLHTKIMTKGMLPIFLFAGFACISVFQLSAPLGDLTIARDAADKFEKREASLDKKFAGAIERRIQNRKKQEDIVERLSNTTIDMEETNMKRASLHTTTNHLNKTSNNDESKPLQKFYAIHIGPSKTGTSAIQKNMAQNPFEINTFQDDKIIFVGRREVETAPDIYKNKVIRKNPNRGDPSIPPTSPTAVLEAHGAYRAVNCMVKMLMDYYDTSNNNNVDEYGDMPNNILESIQNGTMFLPGFSKRFDKSPKKDIIDKYSRFNATRLQSWNELLEQDESIRAAMRQQFRDHCWRQTFSRKNETQDFSYMLDYSLVKSDESLSYLQGIKYKTLLGLHFRAFDILGYQKLLLVGAYRRWADWIVSVYTQWAKDQCLRPSLKGIHPEQACADIWTFIEVQLSQEKFGPIFYGSPDQTLPTIQQQAPSNLEVHILNYFQLNSTYQSITTEWYCDVLGKDNLAPSTCQHALEDERKRRSGKEKSSLVANKGTTSDTIYRMIIAAGYRHGYLLYDEEQQAVQAEKKELCPKRQKKYNWCESLHACYANCTKKQEIWDREHNAITFHGTHEIIATHNSIVRTYQDLSNYHTMVQEKNWATSLPLLCPTRSELETLLNKSLAFERAVLPEFAESSPLGEQEHKRLFWNVWVEEKRVYCTVDIERLFQNATSWDQIINDRMVHYEWLSDGGMAKVA